MNSAAISKRPPYRFALHDLETGEEIKHWLRRFGPGLRRVSRGTYYRAAARTLAVILRPAGAASAGARIPTSVTG